MIEKKDLTVLVIVVLLAAALTYQIGTWQYGRVLDERNEKIAHLQRSLEELKNPPPTPAPEIEFIAEGGLTRIFENEEVNCILCHDFEATKSFHLPQLILKIDEQSGRRRRICIDCHGPLGPPWSSDEQLTPAGDISFNSRIGLNGVFTFPNSVPHSIHENKMKEGAVRCQTCHGEGDELVIPEPDLARGHILVCQNCKYHPEGGNYLTIHVEIAGKTCSICHTQGAIETHRELTEKLGR